MAPCCRTAAPSPGFGSLGLGLRVEGLRFRGQVSELRFWVWGLEFPESTICILQSQLHTVGWMGRGVMDGKGGGINDRFRHLLGVLARCGGHRSDGRLQRESFLLTTYWSEST